ncbi:DNA-binding protein [Paenibacillus sp. Cedars]|uniref:DNA-binding protein n=1 Tax=Paenibacillus sp. Cedars TaxID=1980674 RepID=UPI0011636BDE|nr:DNA-binding protein [Paenibacillus sp. Cedars]AWP28728.1 DNA-binding protein [Paenibacillus sp. Cedars]
MLEFESKEHLSAWISHELISTAEAIEILDCTRQNLHSFVKRERLVPVKETNRERLFWRSEVMNLKEEVAKYNRK